MIVWTKGRVTVVCGALVDVTVTVIGTIDVICVPTERENDRM